MRLAAGLSAPPDPVAIIRGRGGRKGERRWGKEKEGSTWIILSRAPKFLVTPLFPSTKVHGQFLIYRPPFLLLLHAGPRPPNQLTITRQMLLQSGHPTVSAVVPLTETRCLIFPLVRHPQVLFWLQVHENSIPNWQTNCFLFYHLTPKESNVNFLTTVLQPHNITRN